MPNYIIAFDIGGTTIKAGVVDTHLSLLDEVWMTYPSKSDQDADTIINNIVLIIMEQWKRIRDKQGCVQGIGFGFPGPFNYKAGISYIKGLGKYEAIYGYDIATPIKSRLNDGNLILTDDFAIVFENDAAVFTLGEYEHLSTSGCNRLMGITLGTGCGASFIDRGEIIKGKMGVPESGEIFNQPFLEGIIDDYISKRGILRIAAGRGFDPALCDVAELAALAKEGNKEARKVFDDFGNLLGAALKPYVTQFLPDRIVFGGQISKGFSLFQRQFFAALSPCEPKIVLSENLSKSALIGVARVVLQGGVSV
jgi:glucokinase